MNSTLKAIAERYSCRNFSDRVPDDEALQAIAQAAIQAPSGMNLQNWHVIMVKNQALISDMDREGMRALSEMDDKTGYERMMARGGALFYHAPCMAVIAIKRTTPPGRELIDCGILAQNIVLAATSMGIDNIHCGFVNLAFTGAKSEEFKQRLKFPEGYECGLSVLLGYAKASSSPHVPNQSKITFID